MTTQVRFVAQRVPLVDDRGIMTRDWYLFFQNLFDPLAGQQETSTILAGLSSGAGNLEAQVYAAVQSLSVAPAVPDALPASQTDIAPPFIPYLQPDDVAPVIASLVGEIAELRKAINDLRQGPISL